MTDIKVLHLTYDMRIGGTETVIRNIIGGFNDNIVTDGPISSVDMSVLCIEPNLGPFGQFLLESGVQVTNLNWVGGFDTQLIRDIRRHLSMQDIDIIHCHQYTPWVYGTLAAIGTKTKVIFTEHGRFYPDSSSWKRRFVNPLLTLFTDKITAISQATKLALDEYEFIPSRKIQVIYNGIQGLSANPQDVKALRAQLGIDNNKTIFGTVARLDPIKNHTMMLAAFKRALAIHSDLHLVIVGDGDERQVIENKISELDLTHEVSLVGYEPNPVNYIAMMDAFLLPSLSEGTSMTLLEAMSLHKPCLVTDAGGNPEVIEHDVVGYVTANNDVEQYASALIRFLALDEAAYDLMCRNAFDRFNSIFSAPAMQRQFYQVYAQLMGR